MKWTCHDGLFGWPMEVDLEPGVMNDDAVRVFTQGHCHSFAFAAAEILDAPVMQITDPDGDSHVVVEMDDGTYFDARGLRTLDTMYNYIDGEDLELEYIDDPEIDDFLAPRVEDAKSWALAAIRDAGLLDDVRTGAT